MIFLVCFIVLLCVCVVSWPYVIYFPTTMAQYSLFVLKVLLNIMQMNKQTLSIHRKNYVPNLMEVCGKTCNAAVEQTLDSFLLT